jgi:hypothetical protein
MRKLIAIILPFYYLSATVGLAVTVHYCHGDIAAIGIYTEANGCCDDNATCCTCCVDEQFVVKADVDDQLAVSNKFKFFQSDTNSVSLIPRNDTYDSQGKRHCFDHTRHNLPQKPPLWLLNCNLTFYG